MWPFVKHFIAQALIRGRVGTFLDLVERDVEHGMSQLWVVGAEAGQALGAGITTLSTTANGKICTIIAYGGELHDEHLEVIEGFAKVEGCKALRICGRKGWARRLKGFHQPFVTLQKELV